jgi:hypothetical protein
VINQTAVFDKNAFDFHPRIAAVGCRFGIAFVNIVVGISLLVHLNIDEGVFYKKLVDLDAVAKNGGYVDAKTERLARYERVFGKRLGAGERKVVESQRERGKMLEKREAYFGKIQFAFDALIRPFFDLTGDGAGEKHGQQKQQQQNAAYGNARVFDYFPEDCFHASKLRGLRRGNQPCGKVKLLRYTSTLIL